MKWIEMALGRGDFEVPAIFFDFILKKVLTCVGEDDNIVFVAARERHKQSEMKCSLKTEE
jgi:hypothetical protein